MRTQPAMHAGVTQALRAQQCAGMGKGERLGDEKSPQTPIFVVLTIPALEVSLVDHTPEELMTLTLTGLQVSRLLSVSHVSCQQACTCPKAVCVLLIAAGI